MLSVRNNDPVVILNYRFSVTNLGNTPATDIHYTFNHNIPSTSQTGGTWNETSLRYTDLGPKDSRSATRTLLYENKNRDMAPKDLFSAGITGSVTYKDVFAKSHSLSICYLIIASSTDARIDNCHQKEGAPNPTGQ